MQASQPVQACIHRCHSRDIPEFALYLPAGHDVQAAAAEEVDPTGPYVPAAHTEPEQVKAPTTAEYLPASHLKQALGELEKLPAGHWLSTQAEPRPANENLPASQLEQVATEVAPTAAENLPASQSVQEVVPELAT